ncbi:MAG: hypothetical protein FE048_02405 [Thermoplasmata archaeon]|nr:MAG: hypothetical protein FE048_02405 [Thermoplasmata archaeon]
MIQENEVIMFLLGVSVLIFIVGNYLRLKHLPAPKILIAGFCVLLLGWILTIAEGFFWEETLNFLEHMCYAGSAILVATWCWKVLGKEVDDDKPYKHY